MKSVLSKIDLLDMRINSLKKRRVLIDNKIREYEDSLKLLDNKRFGGEKGYE